MIELPQATQVALHDLNNLSLLEGYPLQPSLQVLFMQTIVVTPLKNQVVVLLIRTVPRVIHKIMGG